MTFVVAVSLVFFVLPLAAFEPECPTAWGYEEGDGPFKWGQMDKEWALCDTGFRQSPVRITKDAAEPSDMNIIFDYGVFAITVQNTGHEIKVYPLTGDNKVFFEGDEFVLEQFHFHVPAEHEIDGKRAAAEVHFVHKNKSGAAVALAVMITSPESAPSNPGLRLPITLAPKMICNSAKSTTADYAELSSLLPENRNAFFRYDGSLTTPPCSQPVIFVVMANPIVATSAQIQSLSIAHGKLGNARPLQPLAGRTIRKTPGL